MPTLPVSHLNLGNTKVIFNNANNVFGDRNTFPDTRTARPRSPARSQLPFVGRTQADLIILYYAKPAAQKVKKNTKYKYTIRTYKKQRTTT